MVVVLGPAMIIAIAIETVDWNIPETVMVIVVIAIITMVVGYGPNRTMNKNILVQWGMKSD